MINIYSAKKIIWTAVSLLVNFTFKNKRGRITMSTFYLRIGDKAKTRKILIDMAYLTKHNIIRLPKYYFEDGLYLPYKSNSGDSSFEKYELTKDKIIKEDENFYYFKFPFKHEQVEGVAV